MDADIPDISPARLFLARCGIALFGVIWFVGTIAVGSRVYHGLQIYFGSIPIEQFRIISRHIGVPTNPKLHPPVILRGTPISGNGDSVEISVDSSDDETFKSTGVFAIGATLDCVKMRESYMPLCSLNISRYEIATVLLMAIAPLEWLTYLFLDKLRYKYVDWAPHSWGYAVSQNNIRNATWHTHLGTASAILGVIAFAIGLGFQSAEHWLSPAMVWEYAAVSLLYFASGVVDLIGLASRDA
jgi:hypothetical protein